MVDKTKLLIPYEEKNVKEPFIPDHFTIVIASSYGLGYHEYNDGKEDEELEYQRTSKTFILNVWNAREKEKDRCISAYFYAIPDLWWNFCSIFHGVDGTEELIIDYRQFMLFHFINKKRSDAIIRLLSNKIKINLSLLLAPFIHYSDSFIYKFLQQPIFLLYR